MPLFLFERPTPRPDESPASAAPSRFSAIQNNVRSMLNGSSIYSNSPPPSNNNTPKLPFLGFLRRDQTGTQNDHPSQEESGNNPPSRSPLVPHHTAGSYLGVLDPHPAAPDATYHRHPADVPLSHTVGVDPETEELAEEADHQRRRRRRRRKHHRHRQHHSNHSNEGAWVRRKSERGSCFSFVKGRAARSKCMACLISGLFLLTVLTICTSLSPGH
jgi:hypothetical protein